MHTLTDYYYETFYGCYPFKDDTQRKATYNTLSYLKDNGFTNKDILNIITEIGKKDMITPSDLPDTLWEGSLLKRDTFYYTKELKLPSPITDSFYMEMKILYTIDDVLLYYYSKTGYAVELRDRKKDAGMVNYLLKRYSNLTFMDALDFIMCLIHFASKEAESRYDDLVYKDLLAINNDYAGDALKHFKSFVAQSKGIGYGKIIWRE